MSGAAVALGEPRTRIFGIRHHGPGSARSLSWALECFRPDAILIEGPADADPLVAYVAADGMEPPVALLAYAPNEPARAAFWPFAMFSPEWQALRYAAEHAVPVSFCDLPAAHTLALDTEPGDNGDPLAALAAAGGYDDPERWWDAVIESSSNHTGDGTEIFEAITEAMGALRAAAGDGPARAASDTNLVAAAPAPSDPDRLAASAIGDAEEAVPQPDPSASAGFLPGGIDLRTLQREAYMRQVIRRTLKSGARRIAVVCGAWHAPALAGKLGPAVADSRLLKGLPKVKATLTWVPWTHSRLAGSSGYGAGITSPGWYHHLFTRTDDPIARWFTRVAGALRARDLPVSSAHIIESVRLADTLAALRGRPAPGLSEVTDATRSVLCDGDESMLRFVSDELVVGEALGSVPESTPTVPLDADLRAQARTLRLKQQALAQQLDLDLRKDRDVARSHLLHRLRLLGIDWGTTITGAVRNTGTFRESWALRWEPGLSVAVIEASRWGTTIRTAAEAKIRDRADASDATVADISAALETALLADLGGAVDGLVARLEAVAAVDHDVTHLLAALPGLIRTLRYGDVRSTDLGALARVADGLLLRICAGLPGAVTGLDTDAAAQLRGLIDATHVAIATRDDAHATRTWLAALGLVADRDDVHGALVGRAVRLLCDAEIIADAEAARRLSAALSIGHSPAEKAAWIDGFLGGRGLLLVHDRDLLRRIDSWLRELDEEQFVATLPLLRRTFGAFEAGERQAIARAVREGTPATAPQRDHSGPDAARGALALHAATEILAGAR
ncbi:hypothetical protein C5E45_15810 [Nocardia nova]|uniref:Uncharacterized protein n=1 Tax=Nocardia nova TaxID=37330 RepID=A0A2S6APN3_9NOCA|nr:DUF5682 family protein [Nocardia nova]PPJ27911.1 hypothetical protein C5E41_15035 [Nocardia nova]PPJ37136.1 hypothetical protein C5E45_15810 [Nocardia nova]